MQTGGVTYGPFYKCLPVQAGPNFGLRTDALDRIIDCLSDMMDRYREFVVVQFDIQLPSGGNFDDWGAIGRFSDKFRALLAHLPIESHYVWILQAQGNNPRHHCSSALLVETDYGNNLNLHLANANGLWELEAPSTSPDALIHYCSLPDAPDAAPTLIVRRDSLGFEDSCGRALRWLSRMAHVEGRHYPSGDDSSFGYSTPAWW